MNKLTAVLLASSFLGHVDVGHTANDIEYKRARLQAVSRVIEDYARDSGRVIDDAAAEAYMESVLRRVVPDAADEFSVVLIDDYEASAWIASLPIIHITNSMLTLLQNEAQLALILAHEVEHYRADHAISDYYSKANDLKRGLTRSYRLAAIFDSNSRSREHEREADAAAINAYLAAGYAPEVAVSLFDRYEQLVAANRKEVSVDPLTLYLEQGLNNTHPGFDERKQIVLEAVEQYGGERGDHVGRTEYIRATKDLWQRAIDQSLLLRDGSRLRVYLGGADAQERFGDALFYYAAKAFRLDGSDEEAKWILPYFVKALSIDPDFPEVNWMLARMKWREGNVDLARRYYSTYLELKGAAALPDYLGQDLGLLEPTPLAKPVDPERNCREHEYESLEGYFAIAMPCDWYVREKLPFSLRASKDGWSLNNMFVYSVPYDDALDSISETVSEPADDKLDLLEMSRASDFKDDDNLERVAGTGFETINGRRWGWHEYTWRDEFGLLYRARRYETIAGKHIVGVAFTAPELYYYEDGLDAFGRTLGSLRIINEPLPDSIKDVTEPARSGPVK